MKKRALCVAALAMSANVIAVNDSKLKPSFADLNWYSNRQDVKAQMIKRGYSFIREIPDNGAIDSEFSGKIQGVPVNIIHYFNNKNQLVKSSIVFERNYSLSLYNNWNTLLNSLNSKYGKGVLVNDVMDGYKDSNSLLELEMNRGKKVSSGWLFPEYNYFIGLGIRRAYTNNDDYFVSLVYESPAWGKELDRRNQAGDL